MIYFCKCFDMDNPAVKISLSVTINFFPLSSVLVDMKFVMLPKFGVLPVVTILWQDCCAILGFGQRNAGVEAL